MSTTVWPEGIKSDAAEILKYGELGFIELEAGVFNIVPRPWSAPMLVRTGPYPSRAAALQACHSHLGARAAGAGARFTHG